MIDKAKEIRDMILELAKQSFLIQVSRNNILIGKAEKYITALTIIVGLGLIDIGQILKSKQSVFYLLIVVVSIMLLLIAFVLAMPMLRIQQYGILPGKKKIFKLLGESIKNNDIKVAQNEITEIFFYALDDFNERNTKNAKRLSIAGMLIIVGFLMAIISYIVRIYSTQ